MKKLGKVIVLCILVLAAIGCASSAPEEKKGPIKRTATKKAEKLPYDEWRTEDMVYPVIETGRTGIHHGDADDPAIWVHPTDPMRSLIFGVDKVDGMWVFDMEGNEIRRIDILGKAGNCDVRKGLKLGDGEVDIVAVNLRKVRNEPASKVAVYAINPDWTGADDVVTMLADGSSKNNYIDKDTYGCGMYKSAVDGSIYIFENAATGPVTQYLIEDDGTGEAVKLTRVRDLTYEGTTCEGMVADDALGYVYVVEEDFGVHKYLAEPDASPDSIDVFATAEDGYTRDREGISLYAGPGDEGYLIVVDQGAYSDNIASIWRIYERKEGHKLVKTVACRDVDGNPIFDEDGVGSTSTPIPPMFPYGAVFGHDGNRSTYPVYDWRDVAGDDLKIFE